LALEAISKQEIKSLIESYENDRRHALRIMQDMQRIYNYVPREGLEALAERFSCPVSSLYSLATFYRALSLKPKGKNVIKVCDGTACHIRGSANLIGSIGRELDIAPGETTEDGMFSLELVNCLGSCALAPVMVVNEKYYSKVSMGQLAGIFNKIREGEDQ